MAVWSLGESQSLSIVGCPKSVKANAGRRASARWRASAFFGQLERTGGKRLSSRGAARGGRRGLAGQGVGTEKAIHQVRSAWRNAGASGWRRPDAGRPRRTRVPIRPRSPQCHVRLQAPARIRVPAQRLRRPDPARCRPGRQFDRLRRPLAGAKVAVAGSAPTIGHERPSGISICWHKYASPPHSAYIRRPLHRWLFSANIMQSLAASSLDELLGMATAEVNNIRFRAAIDRRAAAKNPRSWRRGLPAFPACRESNRETPCRTPRRSCGRRDDV